jgi:hypothetical protein
MTELGEELLSYHRDENYKIIRLRDDLISAVRYAFMERYKGKLLDDCESHGRAPGIAGEYDPRPVRPVAVCTENLNPNVMMMKPAKDRG